MARVKIPTKQEVDDHKKMVKQKIKEEKKKLKANG